MIRTMIESLLTDKSGYGKRTLRKDIGRLVENSVWLNRFYLDLFLQITIICQLLTIFINNPFSGTIF